MKFVVGLLVLVAAWMAWWLVPAFVADGFSSWGWPRFVLEGSVFCLLAFAAFRWWEYCDA